MPGEGDLAGREVRLQFDPEDYHVVVPVDLNGRRRMFAIDTGMSASTLDISFIDELGRPLRTVSLETPDGNEKLQLFRMPSASVGGLSLKGVSEVFCLDFWPIRAGTGSDVYGCLGLDFLREHVVQLDFDRGEIAFLKVVPEDSGTSVVLHVGARRHPPIVMLSLPGVGERPFIVGTGYNGDGHIDRRLLQTMIDQGHAVVVDTVVDYSLTKSSSQRDVRLDGAVCLGPFQRRGLQFTEADDNVLGLGYLRRYLVTIDFLGKKLYLKERQRRGSIAGNASRGALIWRPNGATTVKDVRRASAADRAGLKAGDVIEEVDRQLASALTLWRLEGLLTKPGEHILRVRRGNQSVKIVLQLHEPLDSERISKGREK